ncbi:MAG: hypothetical protein RLZZ52_1082, partial [Actinomycetota bacterium]
KAFERVIELKNEFALLMTLEMGKPLAESLGEVGYGAEFLRWFSEEAVRINGRYGINPEGTGRTIVTQMPVGPSYMITPWNFPLAMATRKIAGLHGRGEAGNPHSVDHVVLCQDPAGSRPARRCGERVHHHQHRCCV